MKTELPLSDQNKKLLARALDSAVLLDQQLNLLLDAYDFYSDRYGISHPVQMKDLQVSIKALGTIPRLIALNLVAWRTGVMPDLSREGFELNVLNELVLHMNTLYRAFTTEKIDLGIFSTQLVSDCMRDIKIANDTFSAAPV
jgi:hypothetical protein